MNALYAFLAVVALVLIALIGVGAGGNYVFAVILPYAAALIFIVGFIAKVIGWARTPVPFRVPTTCGQQRSLPWIKKNGLESPFTGLEVIARMFLEVFCFRSLFRNTEQELLKGPRLTYSSSKYLWIGAIAFHYCFLVILLRHFRFFTEPVPFFVSYLQLFDGFMQISLPVLYISNIVILGALGYLFVRRIWDSRLRYLSLPSDYFALFLLMGIALSGILMRYFEKTDVVGIKELAMGLFRLSPTVPVTIGLAFYVHFFLVTILVAYFPFSKLMHMPGVFMSPTRNLANNNRARRHINPWNPKVKLHSYEEYEDEFRDKMVAAGVPVEKE
ncbi:sulfate reduction electron transfer complex DsrMKJOP subunit DsrM [Acidobacteriota bacterium]